MQVILLDKIAHLGSLGDEVKVKSGFARNFLIPQKKAVMATEANRKKFDEKRAELEAEIAKELADAQARLAKLQEIATVTISAKAGDEGKLFGSVGTKDIADAIAAQGLEVHKSEIRLSEGVLRSIGEYNITISFHPDVKGEVKVVIVADK